GPLRDHPRPERARQGFPVHHPPSRRRATAPQAEPSPAFSIVPGRGRRRLVPRTRRDELGERAMDQQIRVLVVDDDESHAEAVAESLERVGYECVVATSGREGLRLIEEQTFDIVITDLMMEEVGGLEVLAKAKRELPDAEVVILTGHSTVKT